MRTMRALTTAALLGFGIAVAPSAQAAYVAIMTEVGSDVLFTGSGTINTEGFVYPGYPVTGLPPGVIIPSTGFMIGVPSTQSVDYYSPFTGPTSFGSGGVTNPTSGSGDRVGIRWDPGYAGVAVPQGYVSGDPLSSSSTFVGASFASLGVTPGTYVWNWGSGETADSLTLYITDTPPAVPEVGSLALLVTAIGGLGLSRRRKTS